MYCCGPTVYNTAHIGNLRTYISEDVLVRAIRACGHTVKHVMNITDVGHLVSDADTGEDKMEKGAAREGKSVWQIAEHYTQEFRANMKALNINEPSVWAKATDHIPEMIALVKTLQDKGFGYRTADGIYFDTSKFPAYRDFAQLDIEGMDAGHRIEMGDKRNITDFALWKFSPANEKRQMEWESPWGLGFPGWHIECSAMALKHLGQPLDIHCGGTDHIRVHHTNEIAQTEAATGTQFSRFWVHGEFLVLDKGKMSKSSGSFLSVKTLVDEGISPLAYRAFCYSAHYRSPLTFAFEGVQSAAQGLRSLKKQVAEISARCATPVSVAAARVDEVLTRFWDAVCDDLNMPKAMAAVWDLLRDAQVSDAEKLQAIQRADAVLGLDLLVPDVDSSSKAVVEHDGTKVTVVSSLALSADDVEKVVQSVLLRKAAKKAKNFAEADRIRAEMTSAGIELKDLPGGAVECTLRK
jgi:cysteinyl-tRNA synthetase